MLDFFLTPYLKCIKINNCWNFVFKLHILVQLQRYENSLWKRIEQFLRKSKSANYHESLTSDAVALRLLKMTVKVISNNISNCVYIPSLFSSVNCSYQKIKY